MGNETLFLAIFSGAIIGAWHYSASFFRVAAPIFLVAMIMGSLTGSGSASLPFAFWMSVFTFAIAEASYQVIGRIHKGERVVS